MKGERKTALFTFGVAERKAAQCWLEEMAEAGWELVKVKQGYFTRAKFKALERGDLRYSIDIADNPMKDWKERQDYSDLLAEAGWDLVGKINGMAIYKSKPGTAPAPIQTDPELEAKRYWKECMRPSLIAIPALLVLLALLVLGLNADGTFHLYHFLGTNGMVAFCIIYLLIGLLLLWSTLWNAADWWRYRRARGQELPFVSIRRAQVKGALMLGVNLLTLASVLAVNVPTLLGLWAPSPSEAELRTRPIVLASDLGLEDTGLYGDDLADSVLLKGIYATQAHWEFYQERYDCRYGWVADLVMGGLYLEESKGTHKRRAEHEPGDLVPVELDFDQAYAAHTGSMWRLLLRQGNVVVRLEGPVDFTDPQVLPILWDSLELEVGRGR